MLLTYTCLLFLVIFGVGYTAAADIITDQNFACAFNTTNAATRKNRLDGLRKSGWAPFNKDEAAVFLAHVFHETDGLKVIREYCAPGQSAPRIPLAGSFLSESSISNLSGCGSQYAGSWCAIQGKPGKLYYGRGWFQLSWPCNYHAAGIALGVDLLSNPDWLEQKDDLAVKTAIWFYKTNKMDGPAKQGDFAATTRIINGKLECNGGSGAANQKKRVATYERIRLCFGLGAPSKNPTC